MNTCLIKRIFCNLSFLLAAPLLISLTCSSQVKFTFQQELDRQHQKNLFGYRLLQLDTLLKVGINTLNIDSLKASGNFNFLEGKKTTAGTFLILDITPLWSGHYFELEQEGKINRLKKLRLAHQLKITSRNIANEVELPKKTNPRQSDNAFYLQVIKNLLRANKELLQADQLDYSTYQVWEKGAALRGDAAVREYRTSFILFLYKHYHLK